MIGPQRTLEANGVRLAYDLTGDGPPLVLIPGRGMPRSWWTDDQVRPYLDAGYSVLRFDNRGMPPSDCPPEPFSLKDLTDDAAALLDALELKACIVIGHSMGSCVAQELAAARPDLVSRLVLVATLDRQPGWLDVFHRGALELFESGAPIPDDFWVAMLFGQLYDPDRLPHDDEILPMLDELIALPSWEDPGRSGQWRAYADYEADPERLGRIQAPTLVVAFERDLVMPPERNRAVAAAIPGARYTELAGMGHWGLILHPAEVHSRALRFLQGAG